jgi:uncharacterized protein YecE (DUF72 family)
MARATASRGDIRVGISGWRYKPWRGVFYPKGLPQRRELEFASRMMPTIEINGSFYSLQRPEYYAQWREQTPAGFVFAVKGPKYITHIRRLKEVDAALANFLASGVFELQDKLGPILWQFPPMLPFKPDRFQTFFEMLPHDTAAAADIAKGHDESMQGRTSLHIHRKRPMRHAVEIRHPSFADAAFIELLRRYKIALVVADTAGKWPLLEDLTADFVYVRLHGDEELYASGYSDEALKRWAGRFDVWSQGRQVDDARLASTLPAPKRARRDIYCYFDNDVKVHAPYDAATLTRELGMQSPLGERGAPLPEALIERPRQGAQGF